MVEIDEELVHLIAEEKRIAPHLHLSLQAGDDLILKRMKRRHNRAQSVAIVERLLTARPEIAIGADLIATRYGYSRRDVDAYACESQRRAAAGARLPNSASIGSPGATRSSRNTRLAISHSITGARASRDSP